MSKIMFEFIEAAAGEIGRACGRIAALAADYGDRSEREEVPRRALTAKEIYDAYAETTGGKSAITRAELPPFESCNQLVQAAWHTCAMVSACAAGLPPPPPPEGLSAGYVRKAEQAADRTLRAGRWHMHINIDVGKINEAIAKLEALLREAFEEASNERIGPPIDPPPPPPPDAR